VQCLLLDHKAPREQQNAYNLTRREMDVLRLLARGLCNKEVANMLKLSVRTVEAHRFSIRTKTGSKALSDLLKIARGMGLAPVNSSGPGNNASDDRSGQSETRVTTRSAASNH